MKPISPIPCPLDPAHPFVRAVRDVAEGRGPLEAVVGLLLAAERKHGLYVLRTGDAPDPGGVQPLRIDGRAPSPDEVLDRLRHRENLEPYLVKEYLDRETWSRTCLHPFLDDAPILLTGSDFSNEFILLGPDGCLGAFGFRSWGGLLASWANSRLGTDWIYLDMYMSLGDGTFEGYDAWATTLLSALDLSARRLLERPS